MLKLILGKKPAASIVFCCMVFVSAVVSLEAASKIKYQGVLKETGTAVDGTKTINFAIFDALTNGTQQWSSGNISVAVTQGVFRQVLEPTGILWGSGTYYLQLTVAGTVLSPREEIIPSIYAIQAQTVDNGAITAAKLASNSVGGDKIGPAVIASTHIISVDPGKISAGNISNMVKITTGNVLAAGTASNTTYLRGDGAWGTPAGSGDMTTNVYDIGVNGIVDNSEKLGAQLPYYYAVRTEVYGSTNAITTSLNNVIISTGILQAEIDGIGQFMVSPSTGILAGGLASNIYVSSINTGSYLNDIQVSSAIYAEKLGNNPSSYYAVKADVSGSTAAITTSLNNVIISTGILQAEIDGIGQFMVSPSTGIMAGTVSDIVKITTGNIFAAGNASNTTFLRGDGTWGTPAGTGDAAYGEMFSTGSIVPTTFLAVNTYVKIANDTSAGELLNFEHTTGKLKYTGSTTKVFHIHVSLNSHVGALVTASYLVEKSGVPLDKSHTAVVMTAATDRQSVSLNCLTSLATNQYIEVFVANNTGTTSIDIGDINVIVASAE